MVAVDEMGFRHREHLDGIGELVVAFEIGRDRHRITASRMRPGERAGTEIGVGLDRCKLRILDVEAALHVVKLPRVILPVSPGDTIQPAEKQVRHCLHQLLSPHDPLPLVSKPGELARVLDVGGEDRRSRLLHLQDDLVIGVTALEQCHPGIVADTPDAHDLHREVDDRVAAGDRLAFRGKRIDVGGKFLLVALADGVVFAADEHRRGCLEAAGAVDDLRQPGNGPLLRPATGLLESSLGLLHRRGRLRLLRQSLDVFGRHPFIEHVERRASRQVGHGRLVDGRDLPRQRGGLLGVALCTHARHERRGESQHIPLERARVGFVEIIDVEDERSLGRCVDAEIREVGIAAELHDQIRAGP